MEGFNNCITECGLHDLDLEGYPFTWERGYGTKDWIEIRLDRALVTSNFVQTYPEVKLINVKISTSDHSPILLQPYTRSYTVQSSSFRFENSWLRDPMCGKIVEKAWELSRDKSLAGKINFTAAMLGKWGKEVSGCFRNRIQHCKKIMQRTKGRKDEYSVNLYQENAKKLMELYNEQEVFWR